MCLCKKKVIEKSVQKKEIQNMYTHKKTFKGITPKLTGLKLVFELAEMTLLRGSF